MRIFLGDYDYYTEKNESLSSGKSYLDQMGKAVGTVDLTKEEERKTEKEERTLTMQRAKEKAVAEKKQKRQLAQTEEKIKETEETIAALEAELCKEEIYTKALKALELSNYLEEKKELLSELYANWLSTQ